jgi:hypothetical protein
MNFSSQGAYKRWLAYGHIHGQFEKTPGVQPVSIRGKSHKVEHTPGVKKVAAAMAKRRR